MSDSFCNLQNNNFFSEYNVTRTLNTKRKGWFLMDGVAKSGKSIRENKPEGNLRSPLVSIKSVIIRTSA